MDRKSLVLVLELKKRAYLFKIVVNPDLFGHS